MRIIAGKYKATNLASIDNKEVRPTSDRLRETIFNVLYHNYPQSLTGSVWDLFAGSGALSLEAISRGATKAILVDTDTTYIIKNVKKLKLEDNVLIVKNNALNFNMPNEKPSLVFIDPPYKEASIIPKILEKLTNKIDSNTIIVVETSHRENMENLPAYKIIDTRKTKNSIAWFLKLLTT